MKNAYTLCIVALFFSSTSAGQTIESQVDQAHFLIQKNTIEFREIVQLDHHRMARRAGIHTPPSIASIFTDDSPVISRLVEKNQEVAMDLPFKFLAYSEVDTRTASITYTSAEFLQKRHGLTSEDLSTYHKILDGLIDKFPQALINNPDLSALDKGFGMIKIQSRFDFEKTELTVRKILNAPANLDTRIFATIDFQKDAKTFGIDIRPTYLMMLGAPKPGGMAMATAPRIGLDAFCQKLLIYQDDQGDVYVALSDMAAFSRLYYGTENKAQNVVTQRMTQAIKNNLGK